jgi:integrase
MPEWLKNSVDSAADLDGVMRACHAIQARKQPPLPSQAPNAQGLDVRSQLPIPAFIDEFIAKLGNKARSTLLGHRSTLNKLARITGVTPISATTAIHCRDLVDRLEKDGLSKASINKAITQTRLFFHWAMRRMLIAADPTTLMSTKLMENDEEQGEPFTPEEVRTVAGALVCYSDEWWWWMISVHSGMRCGELIQIGAADIVTYVSDINSDRPHFRLFVEYIKLKTKKKGERHVPVHPLLIEHGFLEWAAGRPKLFTKTQDTLSRRLTKVLKELGLKTETKELRCTRHTFATRLGNIKPQVKRETKKRLMGHFQRDELEIYAKDPLHPDESAVIDRLDFGLAGPTLEKPRCPRPLEVALAK